MSDAATPLNVLLVEDDDEDAMIFTRYARRLTQPALNVVRAGGVAEAEVAVGRQPFDMIFCDLNFGAALGGMDFLRRLRRAGQRIPVIVVTGGGDETKAVDAMKEGAYDYIGKERLNTDLIQRTVRNTLERLALERERDAVMRRLEEMTVTDALTGVANRRRLTEFLDQEAARSRRTGRPFALLMLDLDHFKNVNDSLGHQIGDQVLKTLAVTLRERLRNIDLVARFGGEEFSVVLPDTSLAGASVAGERLRQIVESLGAPMPTVSIGLAIWSQGVEVEALLGRADKALYRAKQSGRNRVVIYRSDEDFEEVPKG